MSEKDEEATLEYLRKQKILVCTPCYGGAVFHTYLTSMWNLVSVANYYGFTVGLQVIGGDSLITRARNSLVHDFLKTDATHLVFIDADIEFDPMDVFRIVSTDKEIVAGSYPIKKVFVNQLAQGIQNGTVDIKDLDSIENHLTNYVIHAQKPDEIAVSKKETIEIVNGIAEVYEVGTGFTAIKREVFEKMIEAYPEIKYYEDKELDTPKEQRIRYSFFDTLIDEDGRYLSEDYAFCKRWRDLGGKIYLAPDVILNHSGHYIFRGRKVFEKQD